MNAEKFGYKIGQWMQDHPSLHMTIFWAFFAALMFFGVRMMVDDISNGKIAGIVAVAVTALRFWSKIRKAAD